MELRHRLPSLPLQNSLLSGLQSVCKIPLVKGQVDQHKCGGPLTVKGAPKKKALTILLTSGLGEEGWEEN